MYVAISNWPWNNSVLLLHFPSSANQAILTDTCKNLPSNMGQGCMQWWAKESPLDGSNTSIEGQWKILPCAVIPMNGYPILLIKNLRSKWILFRECHKKPLVLNSMRFPCRIRLATLATGDPTWHSYTLVCPSLIPENKEDMVFQAFWPLTPTS